MPAHLLQVKRIKNHLLFYAGNLFVRTVWNSRDCVCTHIWTQTQSFHKWSEEFGKNIHSLNHTASIINNNKKSLKPLGNIFSCTQTYCVTAGSNTFGPTSVNQVSLTISVTRCRPKTAWPTTLSCQILLSVSGYTRKQRGGSGHTLPKSRFTPTILGYTLPHTAGLQGCLRISI